jgi:hypothetical protein
LIERIKGVQELADSAPWPDAARKEFHHQLDYAISLARANQFQMEHTRFTPTSLPPIQLREEPMRVKGE